MALKNSDHLTKEKIDSAVRLAFSFESYAVVQSSNNTTEAHKHLLAWFTALQKRSDADPALTAWLETHSSPLIDLDPLEIEERKADTSILEVAQYNELVQLFEDKSIHWPEIQGRLYISTEVVEKEKAEWRVWNVAERDAWRANRAEGGEHKRDKRRQDRSRSPERRHWKGGRGYRRRERWYNKES